MKKLLILLFPFSVYAGEPVLGVDSNNNGDGYGGKNALYVNDSGQVSTALLACEDQENGVCRVEAQYSPKYCTADCQVKASAGFVDNITCGGTDAAAQAGGTITLYDNTAESGSTYWNYTPAAANVIPFTNPVHHVMATGIYLGFPASATDIWCSVSYR